MKKVRCISIRKQFPNQINEGEYYYVDILSVYGDFEGDWYGMIYDIDMNYIGTINLCHFTSDGYKNQFSYKSRFIGEK